MENQHEEFQVHFVAMFAQAGRLSTQQIGASLSEPFHQQCWGSHKALKGRQQGG